MNQKYEKLKNLLKELFQLNEPDLDFGLYRIMHAKSAEITKFLDEDLLPQVQKAFSRYKSADKEELQKELEHAIAQARELEVNPEESTKVKNLREQLSHTAVDLSALESEVYDHLYSFFRRYYSEGDFLSKRVYKPGVYAIPYEGEEVKLYWANYDQYYIKTSEYLRDYTFRLDPYNAVNPMRVHFKLVDAAEGEHGNVKEAQGKERHFKLVDTQPAVLEQGELVIRFTYEPQPENQQDLNAAAERAILALTDPSLAPWLEHLKRPHKRADGTESGNTRLRVHLERYTARNTFDYFIHKDLRGFLQRELDFYIKNEVMHLDDIENESAPRVEQYLSKIKIIRTIAGKIIDFLAQLEDFQKKLWLKKKFVTETRWCIRVGIIPEEFYPKIAENSAQWEEWKALHGLEGEVFTTQGGELFAQNNKPGTIEFLKAHPTLMIDTKHFSSDFTARLLATIDDIDEKTDGVLVHSENFQALNLMQKKYKEKIQCIYIDPPYNTGASAFIYKNEYRHSSWMTMLLQVLYKARGFLLREGAHVTAIDDYEQPRLALILNELFDESGMVGTLVIENKPSGRTNDMFLATCHEYYLFNSINPYSNSINFFPLSKEEAAKYSYSDDISAHKWRDFLRTGGYSTPEERPNSYYPIYFNPESSYLGLEPVEGALEIFPIDSSGRPRVWRKTRPSFLQHMVNGEIRVIKTQGGRYRIEIIDRVKKGVRPKSVWIGARYDAATHGTKILGDILGKSRQFDFPKSVYAVRDTVYCLTDPDNDDLVLDYFAGSGTTGHAVINLNREDGGRRKFILVEMADYFDTVLLPRIKKVTFTPEWQDGKPKRMATQEEAERSPRLVKVIRLESYEDTLNNLEVRRTQEQEHALLATEGQGPDGVKEHYILNYMLDVETRGSKSLLNIDAFSNPLNYQLKVKRPGSDESQFVAVDLIETFNWLIGLSVTHRAAPQAFCTSFKRDSEGRLCLAERLRQDSSGTWWFRTVIGTTPDGRKTLIIWRNLTDAIEKDNLVLDEWFTRQGYSSKDSEFDLIYVNGTNNLENLRLPDATWKVRLIEEDFHRLMFEMQEGL